MSATILVDETTAGAELIALLTEQCTLYAQLVQLSTGQRVLITGDRPEQLLGVLGERQRLIDRLTTLGERLRPYQRDWPAIRAAMSPAQVRRADELLTSVNAYLAGLLQADAADAELLAARKSEAGQSMGQMKAVRRAGAAYASGQEVTGSRIDWTDA